MIQEGNPHVCILKNLTQESVKDNKEVDVEVVIKGKEFQWTIEFANQYKTMQFL